MDIAPNTDLLILKGVDIDRGYNHSRRFVSLTEQYQFFTNTISNTDTGISVKFSCGSFTSQSSTQLSPISYQRADKGVIRINVKCELLYDCNYIMFRNTSFGSKWFYAFIDRVEYVNNTTSNIYYSIDVIQTWMFDYKVEQCFIEREHTPTDNVGENTVTEDFSVKDYFTCSINQVFTSKEMLCGIILNKKALKFYNNDSSVRASITDDLFTVEQETGLFPETLFGLSATGVINGLYIYTGFLLAPDNTIVHSTSPYYLQKELSDTPADISTIMSVLQDGNLQAVVGYEPIGHAPILEDLTTENIVAVFQYPKELSLKVDVRDAVDDGYGAGFSRKLVEVPMGTKFVGKTSANDYLFSSVRNNKLFTFPFIKFGCYSNEGTSKEYRFEDFRDETPEYYSNGMIKPSLILYGNKIGQTTLTLIPLNYKNEYKNEEHKVSYQYTYSPLYTGNAYAEYMQKNSNSLTFGFIASALTFIGGVIASVASANPMPAVGGTIALANNVGGKIGKLRDLENVAPTTYYNTGNEFYNINSGITSFRIKTETIDGETAKIIDDYFNAFGYSIRQVKVPNIFAHWYENASDPVHYLRPYWNFVKTNGAILHPFSGNGLPYDAEKKISEILDNGITFWNLRKRNNTNYVVEIGDYSMNNKPI